MAVPIVLLYIGSVLVAQLTIRRREKARAESRAHSEEPEDAIDEEDH
jgi:Sec-independent protein secretion pathway component TatC